MAKYSLADRQALARARSLARQEIKKAKQQAVANALAALGEGAELISVRIKLADLKENRPARALLVVRVNGRRYVLQGEADNEFDAKMDALRNPKPGSLPGIPD
jgi:hypothetical protein